MNNKQRAHYWAEDRGLHIQESDIGYTLHTYGTGWCTRPYGHTTMWLPFMWETEASMWGSIADSVRSTIRCAGDCECQPDSLEARGK